MANSIILSGVLAENPCLKSTKGMTIVFFVLEVSRDTDFEKDCFLCIASDENAEAINNLRKGDLVEIKGTVHKSNNKSEELKIMVCKFKKLDQKYNQFEESSLEEFKKFFKVNK
jgi:single-stranded DNA-binding protein